MLFFPATEEEIVIALKEIAEEIDRKHGHGVSTCHNKTGPEVTKLFPCSTQLTMKFYLLVNSKLLINTVVFSLNLAECESFYDYES